MSHKIWIFLVFLHLQSAGGVWKCPTGDCAAKFSHPEDMGKMEAALLLNPMAEFNFHFGCQSEEEAERIPPDLQGRHGGLRECENPSQILPGVREMMFGYNIVTDSFGSTSHIQVLDVTSSDEYRATVLDPQSKVCYSVPDAFASENVAVRFSTGGGHTFSAIGAPSITEYRKLKADSMEVELNLGANILGKPGHAAAFSHSDTIKKMAGMKEGGGGQDISVIEYNHEAYQLSMATPKPSGQLLKRWQNLAELGSSTSKDAVNRFENYFAEVGTHYFASAAMGGVFTATFTTERGQGQPGDSDPQKRAKCVAMKASVALLGTSGKTAAKACKKAFGGSAPDGATASDFLEDVSTGCHGGDTSKCPLDLDQTTANFQAWRSTISANPVPLHGAKKWITQLIDHMLESHGGGGADSQIYRKIILEFANLKDVEQAVKKLREFKGVLLDNLRLYLSKRACHTEDCGRNAVPLGGAVGHEGVELLNPESQGLDKWGSGKWGEMDYCPPGEFAKSATIDVQATPFGNPKDFAGLLKVSLGCNNGKRITSGYLYHGRTSNQVACPGGGYIAGYRLRFLSRDKGTALGDQRGATNIEFRCRDGKSEKDLGMRLDCGGLSGKGLDRCRNEPLLGDWERWKMCPEGHAINGIKTLKQDFEVPKGTDDAGILGVAFWCGRQ